MNQNPKKTVCRCRSCGLTWDAVVYRPCTRCLSQRVEILRVYQALAVPAAPERTEVVPGNVIVLGPV